MFLSGLLTNELSNVSNAINVITILHGTTQQCYNPGNEEPMKYVAYYRVSTRKQGKSGLGLEAQKNDVARYINSNPGELIGEYTEVESGRNNSRVQLQIALSRATQEGATLLIAKLDRLSRNAYFIHKLQEEQIRFVACDMPEANELVIGIMAAIAQDEAKRIRARTNAATATKRQRGIKMGRPENLTRNGRAKGAANRKLKAIAKNSKISLTAWSLRQSGFTYQMIADQMNASGFRTPRTKHKKTGEPQGGKPLKPNTARRMVKYYEEYRRTMQA